MRSARHPPEQELHTHTGCWLATSPLLDRFLGLQSPPSTRARQPEKSFTDERTARAPERRPTPQNKHRSVGRHREQNSKRMRTAVVPSTCRTLPAKSNNNSKKCAARRAGAGTQNKEVRHKRARERVPDVQNNNNQSKLHQ